MMSKGLGKIQRKILAVLKDLKCQGETEEGWVSLNVVIIMVYRPWQIDPEHPANKERIGMRKRSWSYTEMERLAVTIAVIKLEKLGRVKGRILTRGRLGRGRVRRWKEIKRIEEKEREAIEAKRSWEREKIELCKGLV